MADNEKIFKERDDSALLDLVYENLKKISGEIQSSQMSNPQLVEAFDSLLGTYFDIIDDGF